ncbi:YL1 nuclear protein C-terminal domain-containing protein [Lineolata rhizophorae]|uniref:YL1 nuclear protein C-terminal domain-containing protein n=1 Tax=Lineolata rhizophorae TaxID=578093 RepID=A0A6A6P2N5_9PEZI|nr:YL1 nuclear protein C-terminal domain-containing protein [Lineolata rhizophorae]
MAPITPASDETNHTALLDQLDQHALAKPFRNPSWKPPQRRNKTVRQIIADASRREQAASASVLATQNNSGAATPTPEAAGSAANGGTPDAAGAGAGAANIAQAAQNLSTLVLEKNARAAAAAAGGTGTGTGAPTGLATGGPAITYTNIEAAPSLHPSSQRHYCDVTGLPAPYTDPKTRLRYYNMEVYGVIGTMGQGATEGYLAARGAHTVLK